MNFTKENKQTLIQLIDEVALIFEQREGTETATAASLAPPCQMLEAAASLLPQIYEQKRLANLSTSELTLLLLALQQAMTSVMDNCRQVLTVLPPETASTITGKLNNALEKLESEFLSHDEELRRFDEEILGTTAKIQKLKQVLASKISKVEQLYAEQKHIEKTLEIYADANRRMYNSLPQALETTHAKLLEVERQLKEIDQELSQTVERNRHGKNVMEKVAIVN